MTAAEKGAALALVREPTTALGVTGGVKIEGIADVFRLAQQLAQARGFVPDSYYQQPAAIAACILTGMELSIPPMTAMREVHVIKGRPSISATLMLTLAQRAGIRTRWVETTTTRATIGVTVPGQPEQTLTYTSDDAKAAGLWGQGNWSKFPANMLRARATSAAIRAFCPGVIGGSVYESESGELTDGRPTSEVVEAHVIPQAPAPVAAKKRLADCASGDELRAWCAENGARAVRAGKADAVLARGGELEIPADVVRGWLGMPPPYDPETGEVAPEDEPR